MRQIFHTLVKNISSMKTGLVLLALLAIFSAIGSSIFPDMFHRLLLFNALIILLFINLGLCTLNRWLKIGKRLLVKQHNIINHLRQWGLLVLHTGLILILVGGMINSLAGQSGNVKVVEGERVVIAHSKEGEDISLCLEEFEIELYENGMPSQYLSKVLIYKGDDLEQQSTISVNHPLQYDGLKVYQQSYGIMVEVIVEGDGKTETYSASEGQILEIPGSSYRVKVFKYVPDFDPSYGMESKTNEPNNPRVIYSVYQDEQLLGVGAARWGERIEISATSFVEFDGPKPYSVLKVKEDPGLPYAAAGGILFMLGAALAEINIFRNKSGKKVRKTVEE